MSFVILFSSKVTLSVHALRAAPSGTYAELGAVLSSESASNRRAAVRSMSYHRRMKQGFALRASHLNPDLATVEQKMKQTSGLCRSAVAKDGRTA